MGNILLLTVTLVSFRNTAFLDFEFHQSSEILKSIGSMFDFSTYCAISFRFFEKSVKVFRNFAVMINSQFYVYSWNGLLFAL